MEHYRIAIGLRLPQLNNMPDTPTHICRHSRKIQSAKSWDGSKAERRGDLGIDQRDTMKNIIRAPSAPSSELSCEVPIVLSHCFLSFLSPELFI